MAFKFGELLVGHCSLSITCRDFSPRHCWERDTCSASCWICHSVWQQSVALFNELRKQKL